MRGPQGRGDTSAGPGACMPRHLPASPLELHRQTDGQTKHPITWPPTVPCHPSQGRAQHPTGPGLGTGSPSCSGGDIPQSHGRSHPSPVLRGMSEGTGTWPGVPAPGGMGTSLQRVAKGSGQRYRLVNVGTMGCSRGEGTPAWGYGHQWPCPKRALPNLFAVPKRSIKIEHL